MLKLPLGRCSQRVRWQRHFSSKTTKDYYQMLGIPQEATAKEIKTAYFQAAKDHHPDSSTQRFNGKFHDIQEAYKILSSLSKRREYDAFRRSHVRPDAFERMYATGKRDFNRNSGDPYKPDRPATNFAEEKYVHKPTTSLEKTVFTYAIIVTMLGVFLFFRRIYNYSQPDD